MNSLVSLLFTFAALTACLSMSSGREANLGDLPYVVSLHALQDFTDESIHVCTGALVAKQWVLASAGCVSRIRSTKIVTVYGGLVDQRTITKVKKYTVQDKHVHPQYSPASGHYFEELPGLNDLVLLKLTEEVEINENLNVVKLPEAESQPDNNKNVIASGWIDSLGTLQVEDLPILAYDKCHKLLLNYTQDSDTEIVWNENTTLCTGPEGTNKQLLWPLERGGPLVQDGVLHGILSYVLDYILEGFNNKPIKQFTPTAVFTKVTPYLGWIKEVTSKY